MSSLRLSGRLALLAIAVAGLSAMPAWCAGHGAGASGSHSIHAGAVAVTVERNGAFTVADTATGMKLTGRMPEGAGAARVTSGDDGIGAYRQIAVTASGRVAAIRVYGKRESVMFVDERRDGGANADPFPTFAIAPGNLERFSYDVSAFAPIAFGKLDSQGPWVFFDGGMHTMVVSPADNYLVADMQKNAQGEMESGIDASIQKLPAGFTHRTLLVFGTGIGQTLDRWGKDLQMLNHKPPVANDADVVLKKYGYWTDHGAFYYYKYDPKLGYEGTLLAVRDQMRKLGVAPGYMQLDSWWYPKAQPNSPGGDNGAIVYRADKKIFPDGLDSFHQRLGLPLVTHARWFAEESPYRKEYRMSRNVIIDPRYWKATAEYLKKGGVAVYEQDWLDSNARPAINIVQAHAFLAEMAHSMAREGLAIQYCMALPGYFMASTQFPNLETIRVSDDRFLPARYDNFLYTGALAHAVGLWPWSDVFMSTELSNLVAATLSAGPVGTGDALGQIDAANLKRTMRADSVLLKPDVPLRPLDSMYAADEAAAQGGKKIPMVAMTKTYFGKATETYVFSYPRAAGETAPEVPLTELGVHGSAYAWNWQTQKGEMIAAGGEVPLQYQEKWGYEVVAPVNRAGIALLGDVSKIVPLARKRFTSVTDTGSVEFTMAFARGEKAVTVTGYATRKPEVKALEGSVIEFLYDAGDRLFRFEVSPG